MIQTAFFITLGMLIVLSIMDFLTYNKKKGYIPSVMTTAFLIIALILGAENMTQTLFIGVLASMFALLFTDLELWGGWADLKVFIASAMAFPTIINSMQFALSLTIFAVIIKIVAFKIIKVKGNIPFIPVILLAFLGAWALI
jgi:hypothetical protein